MSIATSDHCLPPDLPNERIVARIGLISDTHMPERCAALPPAIFTALRGVDLLLHAGDVGELKVLDQLSALAPVVAVHGNDDTIEAQQELPYQQVITIAGQRLLLTHSHQPDREEELASRRGDAWEPKLEQRAARGRGAGASIVVFGHIHIPLSYWHGDVLLVNPGAIASPNYITRQCVQTVALLFICDDGQIVVRHIDLAAPQRTFEPQINWSAGFQASADQFNQSILSSELKADWEQLKTVSQLAAASFRTALLKLAHRCWSGEQPVITREDLLTELHADLNIPVSVQTQLESVLTRNSPGILL